MSERISVSQISFPQKIIGIFSTLTLGVLSNRVNGESHWRGAAGRGDEPGFLLAIEELFAGRQFSLFAFQCAVESSFDKALPKIFYRPR